MSLLDRVSTLLRANLNDLVEKAEDPERMLKQVVLDMENQLMQVKTQVAIAIADQHLLEKKRAEHEQEAAEWRRKAELAVQKRNDDLARAALERALSHDQLVTGFATQAEDQKHEADSLRQALHKLEQKLSRDTRTLRDADRGTSQSEGGGPGREGTAGGGHRPSKYAGTHEEQGPCDRCRKHRGQRDSVAGNAGRQV